LHRWFTTLSLLIGFNGKKELFTLEDNVVKRDTINLSTKLELRLGLGYNANRVYFGINFVGDSYIYSKSTQEYGTVRLYLGYRFSPKLIKNETSMINFKTHKGMIIKKIEKIEKNKIENIRLTKTSLYQSNSIYINLIQSEYQ